MKNVQENVEIKEHYKMQEFTLFGIQLFEKWYVLLIESFVVKFVHIVLWIKSMCYP